MLDNSGSIERLDLRFRAVPAKSSLAWLPGGAWLWFAVGLGLGCVAWNFGQRALTGQLSSQLESQRSAAEALLALEALSALGADTEALLVVGLQHEDERVARSALQKLAARVDQWSALESEERLAAMRQLAGHLENSMQRLPEANRILVRSLAARMYACCSVSQVAQAGELTKVCQRLISWETSPATGDPANESAETTADLARTVAQLVSDGSLRSSVKPLAVSSGTDAQVTAYVRASPEVAGNPVSSAANTEPEDTGAAAEHDSPDEVPPLPTKRGVLAELPVVVRTPASIANHPVAQLRLVSGQPDLRGIEKADVAELVRLLASDQAEVTKAASLALRHHGLSDYKIELASELAVGSAARRLELIQHIASSSEIDPRPWLTWMAEDGQPEVRRMAISLLSSMLDEQVQRSLRILMAREPDSQIKDLLRKVLLTTSR